MNNLSHKYVEQYIVLTPTDELSLRQYIVFNDGWLMSFCLEIA